MAVEEPKFTVVLKDDRFEVRDYASYCIAQTRVEGDFSEAGNEAFRRLFRYISGENRAGAKVPMAAPVEQQGAAASSEKIPMAAPVQQQAEGGPDGRHWRVAFVLPAAYTLDNAPQPNDARITLAQAPARRMAVVRYRGTWSRARYDEELAALRAFMAARGLIAAGDPVWDRYDPPFMPWFLRRNEIQLPVEPR